MLKTTRFSPTLGLSLSSPRLLVSSLVLSFSALTLNEFAAFRVGRFEAGPPRSGDDRPRFFEDRPGGESSFAALTRALVADVCFCFDP